MPGAELVYRVGELAPRPETLVVVNCAGRTRSIIGAQSLVNAGIPNRVAALRNGTIGWTLAGLTLEHGQSRRFAPVSDERVERARRIGRARVADRAGVGRADRSVLAAWLADDSRTLYRFDVRTPEEYAAGHLARLPVRARRTARAGDRRLRAGSRRAHRAVGRRRRRGPT